MSETGGALYVNFKGAGERMSTQRPAITILEKDQAAREMYCRELAQEYDVFSCASLSEARRVLEQHAVNLLVLETADFGPGGWGFFREMKAEPRRANIPVIVCSTREVRDAEIKKELAACLVKPVLPSELSLVVRHVLENVLKK